MDAVTMSAVTERFDAKVSPEPNTGCFLWTGSASRSGYGRFKLNGKLRQATRVAWALAGRGDPGEMHVLHRCDNPACVNVDHLFLGTHADNMADMSHKGRSIAQRHPERLPRGVAHGLRLHPESAAKGERNGRAKLTTGDVIDIRRRLASGEMQEIIAQHFGVSRPTISLIRSRRIWAHVA